MFGRKSNITNQLKLKTELLKEINLVIYKLEKGQFNKALGEEEVRDYLLEIRSVYKRLENSIGGTDTDITNGCAKVKADLKELKDAANDNLIGRFGDSVMSLICDIEEIIDLEAGAIEEITVSENKENREQRAFSRKLQEILTIEQEFIKNRNRVDDEISKIERDKKELDSKLLAESNPRLKQNIFRQIQASLNKIATLQVKSEQYASCYNLLDSIKTYANELVAAGSLSSVELNKAKIILNINRLRLVLDDPTKLKPLLKTIEMDLKKAQSDAKVIDQQMSAAFNLDPASYEEMNAYQNELIKSQTDKDAISSGVSELEEYMRKLDAENK